MTSRDRFLAAINGDEIDRTPVFPLLMFFAADRAGISYREYATNGRALANAQLLAYTRYGIDAMTACSDAYRVAADLGGEMAYPEDKPPYLARPLIESADDLTRLGRPDPTKGRMADRVLSVLEMVEGASREAAVLGWVEMPFAEACALCGLTRFMMLLMDDPATAHAVLDYVTNIEIDFALAQISAGADMIGAGDAAASLVSPKTFEQFVLPYEQRVCKAIHDAGSLVKLHICGDTTNVLELMAQSGADLFNVDHLVPLSRASEIYSAHGRCFKGNLDPVADMMQATPEQCRAKARKCIEEAAGSRYMLSAGCEIPAATSDEVFEAFCGAVV